MADFLRQLADSRLSICTMLFFAAAIAGNFLLPDCVHRYVDWPAADHVTCAVAVAMIVVLETVACQTPLAAWVVAAGVICLVDRPGYFATMIIFLVVQILVIPLQKRLLPSPAATALPCRGTGQDSDTDTNPPPAKLPKPSPKPSPPSRRSTKAKGATDEL